MNSKTLTKWFDGKQFKPARPGVYMLLSMGDVGYQKWDGKYWGPWRMDVAAAADCNGGLYACPYYQNDNWRGLRTP